MKRLTIFLLTTAITIGFLNACGPSEEEQRQREQARQDSLEQVRQQELAQQKRDSIAQARRDSIAAAQESEEPEPIQFEFSSDGAYTVHVESWRSTEKAQAQVQKWKDRGFENAAVSKFGEEQTGNVWFRVRLGRVENREMAQKLQDEIQNKFDAESWVALNQKG